MPPSTDYFLARERAIQHYEAAFHLLNVTFPLIKDPKLLPGVINNIFASLEAAIDAILRYERQLQLVPPYSDNFQSKFNMFRYKSVRRNKIEQKHVNLITDLKEILILHKKSPVEFQRGNKFVICSKDYHLKIISITDIKKYLNQTKEFLETMERIIKIR